MERMASESKDMSTIPTTESTVNGGDVIDNVVAASSGGDVVAVDGDDSNKKKTTGISMIASSYPPCESEEEKVRMYQRMVGLMSMSLVPRAATTTTSMGSTSPTPFSLSSFLTATLPGQF